MDVEADEELSSLTPREVDPPYTIPIVRFPDGEYVMDSRVIAAAINTRYPTPALPIESRCRYWYSANLGRLMTSFRGVFLPLVLRHVLGAASLLYFPRHARAQPRRHHPRDSRVRLRR